MASNLSDESVAILEDIGIFKDGKYAGGFHLADAQELLELVRTIELARLARAQESLAGQIAEFTQAFRVKSFY